MTQDEHFTKVIFRKFPDGDVIALFPELPGTNNPATMMSYMHVGQHGPADEIDTLEYTSRASPEEYAELFAELKGLGYKLAVTTKSSISYREERKKEIRRMQA